MILRGVPLLGTLRFPTVSDSQIVKNGSFRPPLHRVIPDKFLSQVFGVSRG